MKELKALLAKPMCNWKPSKKLEKLLNVPDAGLK
jgi:hypothetical protein